MIRLDSLRAYLAFCLAFLATSAGAGYENFEVSQVYPIDLNPSGGRLLAVNTPDALLEVFTIDANGDLTLDFSIPVGLEPVTVRARTDTEAWVVNNLSDTISIVDLTQKTTVKTLFVGNEPTDVVFTQGKAFVAVSEEDAVKVYDLANLDASPTVVNIYGLDPRALAVSNDGSEVYAVTLLSGNQTTVLHANVISSNHSGASPSLLTELGLNDITCNGNPNPRPPLPPGVQRNPALTDPPDGIPRVGLIVKWNEATGKWEDEAGQDWSHCLPFRLPDHDLFIINATDLSVQTVDHLGTTLFEVSVHPVSGKIYVANTDSRNFVRFELPDGVRGHIVNNQFSIVDPSSSFSVTTVDLNTHINRASDPATNLAERQASISQPGMMVWKSDGSVAYLTAIGSRKLFRVDGTCLAGSCIFGPDRANPNAVEVGEGPTGVALLEPKDRLYVMNRLDNSIAVVRSRR